MEPKNTENTMNISQSARILKSIFNKYIEDSITEEQIERLLRPILQMIKEGRFDRVYARIRARRIYQAVLSFAAVLVLVITVIFAQIKSNKAYTIVIPDTQVPQASFNFQNSISGKVTMDNKGVEGITLQFEDLYNKSQPVDTTTDVNGKYEIKGFPNGTYIVRIILPDGILLEDGSSKGFLMIEGTKEIEFNNSNIFDIETVVGKK